MTCLVLRASCVARSCAAPGLRVAVLALVVLALGAPATGQVRTVGELKYPPLPRFDIPQPTRVVLDNGMVVILIEDHELPLIDAVARVRTGSRLEPADKVGLASLTGSVMRTGGTSSRSGDALDDYLEGKAASIETSVGVEFGSASMSCLKADFPDVLKVFADVLRNPAFNEDKLKVARTLVTAGIARQNDNPQQIISREFGQLIYGDTSPYARTPTYATVNSITRDDLVAWHATYFHPNRIVLGLAGDFNTAEAIALVKTVFGDWKKGPPPDALDVPYRAEPAPGIYEIPKTDMTQSNIMMGHLGIVRSNPDFYAVEVLNEVLGGSFASRLFSNVRSRKGLAYAVSGGVGSGWDRPGLASLFMTTKTETTGAGIDALLEEARDVVARPPTEPEIERARSVILNSFIFNSDSTRKILTQQLTYEYYGYPLDWLQRYRAAIEKVTAAQVREAARKYITPDRFAILVVGPEKGRDKPLSAYGAVKTIDITIPEATTPKAPVSAEGAKKAEALIAKAVQAMGGAARIDGIKNLLQKGTSTARTPQGEMEIKSTALVVFPDRFRQEMVTPFGTIVTVVTPTESFVQTPQGVMALPESRRADIEKAARRNPLALLRARTDPSFKATAVGADNVGDTPIDLVQIEVAGDTVTVGVDPATGRVLQLRFRGAGPTGAPGDVVQQFSEFRDVAGLIYPFKSSATLNGEPTASSTTDAMAIDGPVDETLFARPPK